MVRVIAPFALFLVILLLPTPSGLTPEGKRVLAVLALAIVLWFTELLPFAVTGLLAIALLVLVKGVPSIDEALIGFSNPVAYFLIGVLAMGLAVMRTGLAERVARYLIARSGGRTINLYAQLVFSFIPMTFVLPSATTRSGILIHVYEQVLVMWNIARDSGVAKAVMMALAGLNRVASTAVLTGGMTPVAAAALIGGFSWSHWFVMMSVPYYTVLLVGGFVVFLLYRKDFVANPTVPDTFEKGNPIDGREIRAAAIIAGASLLWLTDSAHHLPPVMPALIALVLLLTPGIGVLSWRDFERNVGWSTFFVLTTSLSLANALTTSGTAQWLAEGFLNGATSITSTPWVLLIFFMISASLVRLAIPNIQGFLALVIPVSMSVAQELGLNPLVTALAVLMAGDSVLYLPNQSPSSVLVFQRGFLTTPDIFRFGLIMTVITYIVVLTVAIPYWSILGEPLTP